MEKQYVRIGRSSGGAAVTFPVSIPRLADNALVSGGLDTVVHDSFCYMFRPEGIVTSEIDIQSASDYLDSNGSWLYYGQHYIFNPVSKMLQWISGGRVPGEIAVRDIATLTLDSDPFNGATSSVYFQAIVGIHGFANDDQSEPLVYADGASTYPITAVDQSSKRFTVTGDATGVQDTITVIDSTGNDGKYTVTGTSLQGSDTYIFVSQSIADATGDGTVSSVGSLFLPAFLPYKIDNRDLFAYYDEDTGNAYVDPYDGPTPLGVSVDAGSASDIKMLIGAINTDLIPKFVTFAYWDGGNDIAFLYRDSNGDLYKGTIACVEDENLTDSYYGHYTIGNTYQVDPVDRFYVGLDYGLKRTGSKDNDWNFYT